MINEERMYLLGVMTFGLICSLIIHFIVDSCVLCAMFYFLNKSVSEGGSKVQLYCTNYRYNEKTNVFVLPISGTWNWWENTHRNIVYKE